MKCPNCGAETTNNICEFCGSEMPKPQQNVSITNNYYGGMPVEESEEVFAGKCPKCGSSKISFKRERVGSATVSSSKKAALSSKRKGQAVSQTVYRTIGICQNCGYTWNPNGENSGTNSESKGSSKTWLWVLGWIFIFPLPLTILLLRKKDMKPGLKYGIIAAAWLLYLVIVASGASNSERENSGGNQNVTSNQQSGIEVSNVSDKSENLETNDNQVSNETTSDEDIMKAFIENIVEEYNASANEQLVYSESFVPNDKTSSHYRTEFRLTVYDNSFGESFMMGDKVVDLVCTKPMLGDIHFRVYSDTISFEQAKDLISGFSPSMDKSLSAKDLQNTIVYIDENKYANGYYYGKLGLVLLGNDSEGYDLMIKLE